MPRPVLAAAILLWSLAAASAFGADGVSPDTPACCRVGSEEAAAREFHADGPITFFGKLLDTSDYPPRWYCGSWTLETGWLHVVSDLAIFAAYFSIPAAIVLFLWRRRDVPYPALLSLFAAFILACGLSHLVEATIFWWPAYRLSGVVKAVTAIVSWITVFAGLRVIPQLLTLPGIAKLNAELREREAFLNDIIEASPSPIFWKDRDGRIAGGNQKFADFMGVATASELIGADDASWGIDPRDVAAFRADDRRVLDHGESLIDYEERLTFPGGVRLLNTSKVPLRDDAGQITGLLGVISDVTEQRRSEEAVARQQREIRKLSLVAANTRHSVVITDAAGLTEWVNDAFTELTGYSADEAIGHKPGVLLQGPLTDPETVRRIGAAIRERRHVAEEIVNYRKDGEPYWILLEISPAFDEAGELTHFVATQSDITERKQRHEQLLAATEQAQAANRAKSEFLANMSHEIRTPLNGILGFTELMLHGEGSLSREDRVDHLRTIRTSGQHLLMLINDVLDLSKIEAGQLQVERAPCSPHALLAEVVSVLRVRAREKGIDLEYRWATRVPETVETDGHRLKQSLMNLIGNAIKFTEQGGVQVVASLRDDHDPAGARLEVAIRDTGVGIAPDRLESIFDPFVQADNSVTRKFGGTGLGLAISRRIADALGGDVRCESRLGHGSCFTVTVEAGSLEGVDLLDEPPELVLGDVTNTATPGVRLDGLRVLVADDGGTNRKLIRLLLTRAGATVRIAENGRVALQLATASPFDVILMDMQMPVMDGYEATRRLRAEGYEGPIIALTANAMKGDRGKCLGAGCSGYLAKPIDLAELTRTLSEARRPTAQPPAPPTQSATGPTAPPPPGRPAGVKCRLPTDDPAIRAIVEEFLEKLATNLDKMQDAAARDDHAALAELAHWLKGAGGTVGFDCFTEPARELEDRANSGSTGLTDHVASLRELATLVDA